MQESATKKHTAQLNALEDSCATVSVSCVILFMRSMDLVNTPVNANSFAHFVFSSSSFGGVAYKLYKHIG